MPTAHTGDGQVQLANVIRSALEVLARLQEGLLKPPVVVVWSRTGATGSCYLSATGKSKW